MFTHNIFQASGQQGYTTIMMDGTTFAGDTVFGDNIAISADGNTCVIGRYTGSNSTVKIYRWVSNAWSQVYSRTLSYNSGGIHYYGTVALDVSADGGVVMFNAWRPDVPIAWLFAVKWNGTTYVSVIDTAYGGGATPNIAEGSASISADGNYIVASFVDKNGTHCTECRHYNGSVWANNGDILNARLPYDQRGNRAIAGSTKFVALNQAGNSLGVYDLASFSASMTPSSTLSMSSNDRYRAITSDASYIITGYGPAGAQTAVKIWNSSGSLISTITPPAGSITGDFGKYVWVDPSNTYLFVCNYVYTQDSYIYKYSLANGVATLAYPHAICVPGRLMACETGSVGVDICSTKAISVSKPASSPATVPYFCTFAKVFV